MSERPPKSCRHAYRSSRSLKTSVCALVDLFPPSPRRSNAYPRGVVERDQFSPEQERKQRDDLQPMIATETYTIRGREVFEPILVNSG